MTTPLPPHAEQALRKSSDTDPSKAMVRAAMEGDARSTKVLLELVAPRIASVVRVVLGSAHSDADDAIQQSLIGFVHALPSFRGECEPARFAARIALRTAMATRRRTKVRTGRYEDTEDIDTLSSSSPAPLAQVMSERRRRLIQSLLDELPEEQGEALGLRIVLGWSLEEIATGSGAPLNTVRSRLRLAKEALRRRIENDPRLSELLGGAQ